MFKMILFDQYYCPHASGPSIAVCETNSSKNFVIDRTSFEQNNCYFLHAVLEGTDAFNSVLKVFGFFLKDRAL